MTVRGTHRRGWLVLAIAVPACETGRPALEVIGAPPAECEAVAPDPAGESFDDSPLPVSQVMLPIPTRDPDCASSTTIQTYPSVLAWHDRGVVRVTQLTTTLRGTLLRSGAACHVRLVATHRGEPLGRGGAVQACGGVMMSIASDSLEDAAFTVEAMTLDGAPVSFAPPVTWGDQSAPGPCQGTPIERAALSLEVVTDLSFPLETWRRLHAWTPPLLVVRVAVQVF